MVVVRRERILESERVSPGNWLLERWVSLGSTVEGRRVPGTLVMAFAALVVGFIACVIATSSGINLAYSDAQSHLTIARRIFDSKAPGFTQLGTVWLPIPTLLLLPFVQSLWLWHTGWAACILGTLCLMATAAGVYRVASRIGLNRAGRIVSVLLILLNPSILYLYTTASTEPVLIACMMGCFAGLARWVTSNRALSAGELMVFCGIPAAGATLSRYEGWVLVLAGTSVVMLVAWRRKRSWRYSIKIGAAFAVLPVLGIVWWLAYNFAVYSNPLEFMFGEYSAYNLQKATADAGLLAYTHNLGLSLWTYNWSVLETAGLITVVLGVAGAIVLAWLRGVSNEALIVWLMGGTYGFLLLSLYLGQTHMNNDYSFPKNWFNGRFALAIIPWLAVLAAVLVDALLRIKVIAVLSLAIISAAFFGQSLWWLQDPARSSVIAEAQGYMRYKAESGEANAVAFLREHYKGGGVLMDESAADSAALPEIGIPLVDYYNRSTGDLFTQAMARPATHAQWVFISAGGASKTNEGGVADLVWRALRDDPAFFTAYRLAFSEGTYKIFERVVS